MMPRPPSCTSKSSTVSPKGLSTALMSTGVSPVTHTADVERKAASIRLRLCPFCQLAGVCNKTAPTAITARNEKTGQVRGLKNRFRCILTM